MTPGRDRRAASPPGDTGGPETGSARGRWVSPRSHSYGDIPPFARALHAPGVERVVERALQLELLLVVSPVQQREAQRDRAQAGALRRHGIVLDDVGRVHDAPQS